jgi:hypothetical protein
MRVGAAMGRVRRRASRRGNRRKLNHRWQNPSADFEVLEGEGETPSRQPARTPALHPTVENYFNYFSEIEERYLRRRGGGLLLSTLDWALIESWKEAGVPLEAALRGIDAAFDRYDERPRKTQKINSLAYCSQAVLMEAENMKEAAEGAGEDADAAGKSRAKEGFEPEAIAAYLVRNAELLEAAGLPTGLALQTVAREAAGTLRQLAEVKSLVRLQDLERRLTVLEEKLLAALLTSTADEEIVAIRAEADRDVAPYRRKMPGVQIEQLQRQYVQKRLLEKFQLPRLSLFYM